MRVNPLKYLLAPCLHLLSTNAEAFSLEVTAHKKVSAVKKKKVHLYKAELWLLGKFPT